MKRVFLASVCLVYATVSLSTVHAQATFEAKNQEQSTKRSSTTDPKTNASSSEAAPSNSLRKVAIASLPVATAETNLDSTATASISPLAPTSIYLVGIGDVLDIQLRNAPIRDSTLFSVLAGGLLDYPLAGEPVLAAGLTTEEIGARLASRIKIYENPKVIVTVREYASHNVIVTGLVHDPGTKALRREAVPLFILLAEAQPRAEAARALIMRTGAAPQMIEIADSNATSVLIYANDVIRLVAAPPAAPLYFYIAGQIALPGQKDFHQGMTLTQAIFASGGTRSSANKAKVMRQGADGRLVTTEFSIKKIEQGKIPDPQVEAGDRIEITRSGW